MINKLRRLVDRSLFYIESRQAIKDPIAWRNKYPILPPSDNPIVTFAMPIFEKRRAPNWDVVLRNLKTSINAVRAQSNPNWRIIICSQDVPEGIDFDDRVIFLRYSIPHHGRSDQIFKLRHIARFIARQYRDDGYVFFLDGDDIPHPNLVDFILKDNNGQGYYIDKGYSADFGAGVMLETTEQEDRLKPFYLYCGSCSAVRFDVRNDKSNILHVALRDNHMSAIEDMKNRVGLELSPIPFPAMIYAVDHGSSMQDKRARRGNYINLPGVKVMDDQKACAIFSEFGLVVKDNSIAL